MIIGIGSCLKSTELRLWRLPLKPVKTVPLDRNPSGATPGFLPVVVEKRRSSGEKLRKFVQTSWIDRKSISDFRKERFLSVDLSECCM